MCDSYYKTKHDDVIMMMCIMMHDSLMMSALF